MTKGELREVISMTIEEQRKEQRNTQAQIEVLQMKLKEHQRERKGIYDNIKIQQVKYNFIIKEIQRKQEE